MTTPWITANLSDEQKAVFYAQMSTVQKDEVVGVLLALFLGTFGAHHFYLRRNGLGIMYALFFWTGLPTLASLIECFFMPGRVRQFNAEQATLLATSLQYGTPGTSGFAAGFVPSKSLVAPACASCGAPLVSGVKFCSRCGTAVAPSS